MDESTTLLLLGIAVFVGLGIIIVLAFLSWFYLLIGILIVGGLIGTAIAAYHFVSVLIEAHQTIY